MKRWLSITVTLIAVVYLITASASGDKRVITSVTNQKIANPQSVMSGDIHIAQPASTENQTPAINDLNLKDLTARSPNFNIDRYSINSGGDIKAVSTNFASGISVAQSAAGEAISANYQMEVGFWHASGCCRGLAGNIDDDPADIVDIADLTFLIDHLFINFPPLACPEEGNVDGDPAGIVDIADLTFLIDHLFINFPPTAGCR